MQTGATMADANRFKLEGDGYYLKSPAEMRELFAELPEACDNTLAIAERCDVSFTEGNGTFMPRYPGARRGERGVLVRQRGRARPAAPLSRRHPRRRPGSAPTSRPGSSCQMGFSGYFLVVADFIQWAKDNGIRVGPGRGSGAGSMAAYAMRITDLDPLVARPALRALPQPRARLDARLRHRLRRAPAR